MEVQKIINLLESSDDDELKFQTKKLYIINDQNNGQYELLPKLLPNLIKVASPILKNVALPLGLSAAMSGIDGGIKKNTWFWNNCNIFK